MTSSVDREPLKTAELYLVGIGILFFIASRSLSYFTGFPPLDLLVIGLIIVATIGLRSVLRPALILILIAIGTMLGDLVHFFEGGIIPVSLFQIFYIGGLVVFVLRWYAGGFPNIVKTGFELELALFFCLVFLSLLWAPDAERGFMHAIRMVVLSGILFLCVNWIREKQQITYICVALVLTGTVIGIAAVLNVMNNPMAIIQDVLTGGTRMANRARFGQSDPNFFASLYFLPVAFTASLVFSRVSIWIRGLAGVFMMIMIASVMVTFSRSAWISLLIMLIVIAVIFKQHRLFLLAAVFGLVIIASIPEFRYLFMNIINRFVGLFTGGLDASNTIRILLIYASFHMFFDSWLIGIGWRGFPDAFGRYYSKLDALDVNEPHNVVYLMYAELGIFGLLLLLFIVYKMFSLGWHNVKFSTGVWEKVLACTLFGTLLAYGVFYQFLGSGFLDNQLWLTTGLIISLKNIIDRKHQTKQLLPS